MQPGRTPKRLTWFCPIIPADVLRVCKWLGPRPKIAMKHDFMA
ncbi:hypothetical protein RBSWK_03698 [Rhodopirellula baltica SWK14]|uniref:Uncharacterized protein n=1 Tax=Rhodopirellula baltica SWK14 TaxID=993516 RepID=L7CDT7_RHOBT|nr:hypothetical protein RBSWK_03698 [Rhodopirellula baltica SWK14]